MPAVVRVKRRIDEEPLEAFVLNGKKRRIEDNDAAEKAPLDLFETSKDEISTILKFAGTVQSQDEKATTQITRLSKDEAIELAKKQRQQPINTIERGRQEMRAQSHENRFKVVNCFRAIDTETEDATPKEITIVDIEKQPPSAPMVTQQDSTNLATTSLISRQNGNATPASSVENFTPTDSDGYVYDLYLPENEQQADDVDYTDNYLSIRAYEELVFEDCYNDNQDGEESEDSNEENYFGNDYPDEEDDNDSIGVRDMRRALEGVNIGSDEDEELSSDEEYQPAQDGFIFTVDTLDENFEDDIDYRDEDRYGTAYARYKAKILRDLRNGSENEDEDCDENEDSD